mmetsp:Transcript_11275/g.24934  ORF Transcript_11275/g.24934 Transcript_11275/m.24934 type:complete len:230 (-) Transcript_11275:1994-2683(-)
MRSRNCATCPSDRSWVRGVTTERSSRAATRASRELSLPTPSSSAASLSCRAAICASARGVVGFNASTSFCTPCNSAACASILAASATAWPSRSNCAVSNPETRSPTAPPWSPVVRAPSRLESRSWRVCSWAMVRVSSLALRLVTCSWAAWASATAASTLAFRSSPSRAATCAISPWTCPTAGALASSWLTPLDNATNVLSVNPTRPSAVAAAALACLAEAATSSTKLCA